MQCGTSRGIASPEHRFEPAFPRYGGLQLTVCTDSAIEIRDIATV
jgi:hypothetical protein